MTGQAASDLQQETCASYTWALSNKARPGPVPTAPVALQQGREHGLEAVEHRLHTAARTHKPMDCGHNWHNRRSETAGQKRLLNDAGKQLK